MVIINVIFWQRWREGILVTPADSCTHKHLEAASKMFTSIGNFFKEASNNLTSCLIRQSLPSYATTMEKNHQRYLFYR